MYEISGFQTTGNLTVSGSLSASGDFVAGNTNVYSIQTDNDGTSKLWYSVYNSVNSVSGRWDSASTYANTTSAALSYVNIASGRWDSASTYANTTSAAWSVVNTASGGWDSASTYVNSNSAAWSYVNIASGRWDSASTYVNSNSADNTLTTTICATSGNGSSVFQMVFTKGLLTDIILS